MNLIGHYTCAAVPSPEVRAGAVLPDLASLYDRRVRPLALARDWQGEPARSPPMEALLAGVAFHHAVDVRFHREPLFERMAAALQQALLSASRAPGLKRFLPAHVLSELYLDHLLLARDPGLAAAFYRDVAGAGALLTEFMARHPRTERGAFAAFLRRLVDDRFVEAYRSHAGILGRMNRILLRFGQRALGPAEQEAVVDCWQGARAQTERELEAFLQAMHRLAPQQAAAPAAADWREAAARQWATGRLSGQFA